MRDASFHSTAVLSFLIFFFFLISFFLFGGEITISSDLRHYIEKSISETWITIQDPTWNNDANRAEIDKGEGLKRGVRDLSLEQLFFEVVQQVMLDRKERFFSK